MAFEMILFFFPLFFLLLLAIALNLGNTLEIGFYSWGILLDMVIAGIFLVTFYFCFEFVVKGRPPNSRNKKIFISAFLLGCIVLVLGWSLIIFSEHNLPFKFGFLKFYSFFGTVLLIPTLHIFLEMQRVNE